MEQLSQVRKKIYELNRKRWSLLEKVMTPGQLLTAQFYERYTKCSNPNCKCAQGELHGPFPWIYQNRKGKKRISTSCLSSKITDAEKFSDNYNAFKRRREQIREIDEEIDSLVARILIIQEVNAEEFTKKEGESRGRKQKESNKSIEGKEN